MLREYLYMYSYSEGRLLFLSSFRVHRFDIGHRVRIKRLSARDTYVHTEHSATSDTVNAGAQSKGVLAGEGRRRWDELDRVLGWLAGLGG